MSKRVIGKGKEGRMKWTRDRRGKWREGLSEAEGGREEGKGTKVGVSERMSGIREGRTDGWNA